MDIIVTTPKREMANAAREAEDCKRDGGGEYFRRFPQARAPHIVPGDRIYYVEDGYVRGFAVIDRTEDYDTGRMCDSSFREWPPGVYAFMDATTWKWIRPLPMKGFRGFRYARPREMEGKGGLLKGIWTGFYKTWQPLEILGGWLDPKPEVEGGGI